MDTVQRSHRAAILAVGTEVTEGQILNRNATWLAHHLSQLGMNTTLHMAVPDEAQAILNALDVCERQAAHLFVTGGLGPTRDDLTREIISQWVSSPLVFHPESWDDIQAKLNSRGSPVLDVHRRQAHFPQMARVLKNSVGTADGFALQRQGPDGQTTHVWVFPGPPSEVESIWANALADALATVIPADKRLSLMTWKCMGKGESEIAGLVDVVLEGSDFEVGYRLDAPYVEVKIWCRADQQTEEWVTRLEGVLAPWLVVRHGEEDVATQFLAALPPGLTIIDAASDGILAERLNPLLRKQYESLQVQIQTLYAQAITDARSWVEEQVRGRDNILAVAGFTEEGGWAAALKVGDRLEVREWPAVGRKSWWTERGRRVVCELALQHWVREFKY